MVWVLLIISLAAVSFSVTIVMQHLNEASGIVSRTDEIRAQHDQAAQKLTEAEHARDAAKQEASEATESLGKLQTEADELKGSLDKYRQDRERRGKYRVG